MALDSVGYALAAASGWGIGDFLAALSAARMGFFRTAVFTQAIGGLLVFVLTAQELSAIVQVPEASMLSVGLGLMNVVAVLASYKSFEVGKLSVVSPIASSFPALSTTLSIIFLGEVVSPLRSVGILFTLGGIVVVTAQTRDARPKLPGQGRRVGQGIEYALVAFTAYGVLYFALKPVVDGLGPYVPVLIMRVVLFLVLAPVVLLRSSRPKSNGVTRGLAVFVLVIAASDIFAGISYNLGVLGGQVSVVSTISGLYSVITVVLARAFLKERLTAHQGIGVIALLIGVGLLGFAS